MKIAHVNDGNILSLNALADYIDSVTAAVDAVWNTLEIGYAGNMTIQLRVNHKGRNLSAVLCQQSFNHQVVSDAKVTSLNQVVAIGDSIQLLLGVYNEYTTVEIIGAGCTITFEQTLIVV